MATRPPARSPLPMRAWVAPLALAACAHGGDPPPRDATADPEFQAALGRARPEFPRQREALAAGLYEPFVPPESLPPPVTGAGGSPAGPGALLGPGDGTTASAEPARIPPAEPAGSPDTEPARAPDPEPAAAAAAKPASAADPGDTSLGQTYREAPGPPVRAAPEFALQLGAFSSEAAGRRRAAEARAVAPEEPVRLVDDGALVRVLLGRFGSRAEAEAALQSLAGRGVGPAFVTRAAP
jgi:cell division septation protein DedD